MRRGLQLIDFGLSSRSRVLLRGVSASLPARGIVQIIDADEGATLLGRVLARHSLDDHVRAWGELLVDGVDWRIRPPAFYFDGALRSRSEHVLSYLLGGVPPQTFVELLASGDAEAAGSMSTLARQRRARAWAGELLATLGLAELALDRAIQSLTPAERLKLALARASASGSATVYLDGVLHELDDAARSEVHDMLRELATRALVMIRAREAEDALGGARYSVVDQQLILDGAAPPASAADERHEPPPTPPTWFRWIRHGKLAGMPRPGLTRPLVDDLETLRALEIRVIVTLEERAVASEAIRAAGFELVHAPIDDMHAPTPAAARALVAEIEGRLERGERVAVHCRAGLGRTGTILAAYLITRGYAPADAISLLRLINPYYIQSEEQLRFLAEFEP